MERSNWREAIRQIGLEAGPAVRSKIKIHKAAADVWSTIAEEGGLKKYHPFCQDTEVKKWPGPDSVDTITYYSGISYKRNFVEWLEGVGYDIEVGEHPKLTSRVVWRVEATNEAESELSIEVFPYLRASLSREKKQIYIDRLFSDVFQHYLDSVVKGVQFNVETGKNISPNQFGTNPHYS